MSVHYKIPTKIPPISFTPREKEVAQILFEYPVSTKAARILGISISTIKFHTASIREKMNTTSTRKAVYKAHEMGLLR